MCVVKTLMTFLLILSNIRIASSQDTVTWWNPTNTSFSVIEGQGWHTGLAHFYDRLPIKVKGAVRKPVWYLSEDGAGLIVRFRSNATNIHVRYTVSRKIDRPHMPATGVSGVDLYALDEHEGWNWSAGKYHFGDTIIYNYTHLKQGENRSYFLYLPLYNQVTWLEIGVPDTAILKPVPTRDTLPIVVYGTSITQGLCASRPGMAWTALLGRKLHSPMINLGFSGNGRLEMPIIQLMTELEAKIYILDCMPNMWYSFIPSDTVRQRLTSAVRILEKEHPEIPILLVEDADVHIMPLDTSREAPYRRVNRITKEVFEELKAKGMKNIYLLTAEEIGLNNESTVEGTHPNDYGMVQYAKAYERKIHEIFQHSKFKNVYEK